MKGRVLIQQARPFSFSLSIPADVASCQRQTLHTNNNAPRVIGEAICRVNAFKAAQL